MYRHERNSGKGAAVRTAIEKASGDFSLIQDADLEYDPAEYPRLLRPLLDGHADAVFGSRYMAGEQSRVLPFWHSMINKGLTLVSNMFCNLNLTDMETCYKVFRTDLLKSIPIRSDRFGFEPEIVMKSAKRKFRIYEVPISYHGRTYEEGKKIGWKDGLKALGVILKFWVIDDLYAAPYGRGVLNNLTGTPQYLSWLARKLRPHLGDTVLEVGAGIGNHHRPPDGAAGAVRRRPRRIRCTCTRCATAFCGRRTWWCSASIPRRRRIWPAWRTASIRCSASTFWNTWTIPRAVLRIAARHLEAAGRHRGAGAAGAGPLRQSRRSLGHKRRYTRGRRCANCWKRRASRWRDLRQFNQGRRAAVVGLQQDGRLDEDQQAGSQDFR